MPDATSKQTIMAAFEEIAQLMELQGENPFKSRSYVNAARTIEQLGEDLEVIQREGRLREIKGVGEAIAEKIETLLATGRLPFLEELRAQFPPTIFELFSISGLGAKRIKQFYDELGIKSMADLQAACEANKLAGLKGVGEKMQAKLLEGISFAQQHTGSFHYHVAEEAAQALLAYVRSCKAVQRAELAGSLRRRKEVIKDIDIVASSKHPETVMLHFVAYPGRKRVTGHGDTKSSIVTESGISADLRVVADDLFPYTLMHFTGSKEHNVVMRQRAKDRALKLNEYGLHREDESVLPCHDEAAIYAALDLPHVPPELREDSGEFELTTTPTLITDADVRGVIHCHTTYSDGRNTLEEMVEAGRAAGYEYILITDHSQTASYAGGLKPDDIVRQHEQIDALNKTVKGIKILKGIESDILGDGALDYEDDVLKSFDLIVASVHNRLDMAEAEATARVVRAIENPYCDIIGHPTGRLLLQRKGFPLDFDRIFDACLANNTALEINANCLRLDLDWRLVLKGKRKGVKFCVGPDAHRTGAIANIRYGVGIARKGGLEPSDVICTYSLKDLMAWRKSR